MWLETCSLIFRSAHALQWKRKLASLLAFQQFPSIGRKPISERGDHLPEKYFEWIASDPNDQDDVPWNVYAEEKRNTGGRMISNRAVATKSDRNRYLPLSPNIFTFPPTVDFHAIRIFFFLLICLLAVLTVVLSSSMILSKDIWPLSCRCLGISDFWFFRTVICSRFSFDQDLLTFCAETWASSQ